MMLALPTVDEPPMSWRIEVPASAGWLTLNDRVHWSVRQRLTRHYRQLGKELSIYNHLPRMERAYVVCELRFADVRRRDPHNWAPTAKAIIDGMVDAGVFPDDDYRHITGPDMRIGDPVKRGGLLLVMHIWPGAV